MVLRAWNIMEALYALYSWAKLKNRLEQNRKIERLNYTLIFLLKSILASIKLPKLFRGKILKTVASLKNWNPSQKGIISYKKANEEKPNLKHLYIIGLRTWVDVSIKLRKNLIIQFGKEFLLNIKGKTFIEFIIF